MVEGLVDRVGRVDNSADRVVIDEEMISGHREWMVQ